MLEEQDLIPEAIYYGEMLSSPTGAFSRLNWHSYALEMLKGADVVFLDPDNGLIVKSVGKASKRSNKYVLPGEIADYFARGKSVIFYNHRCREKESAYLRRFDQLRENETLKTACFAGVKFTRGTVRDYIFLLQPYHEVRIMECVDNMIQGPWGNHFSWHSPERIAGRRTGSYTESGSNVFHESKGQDS